MTQLLILVLEEQFLLLERGVWGIFMLCQGFWLGEIVWQCQQSHSSLVLSGCPIPYFDKSLQDTSKGIADSIDPCLRALDTCDVHRHPTNI